MSSIEEKNFVSLKVSGEEVNSCYHEAGTEYKECVIFAQTGGAGTTAYMSWHLNMATFADAGYHVYAPDFVDYGHTKRVSEERGRISASEFILAFMDVFGIGGAHFIGNSMGSNAITQFVIDHPERVKSLILTGSEPIVEAEGLHALTKDMNKTARTDFVKVMLNKPKVLFDDMRRATADFFYDRDHPRIDEVAKQRLEAINQPGMREQALAHAMKTRESGRGYFQASQLGKIQAPTYLIHGRDERHFFPKETASVLLNCAIQVAMCIPDCSCTILAHCGHWPQIEKANTFNAMAREFLDRQKAKAH